MAERVINFSAGPAHLPEEVLREAQADMLNWKGAGMSVMGMGTAVAARSTRSLTRCSEMSHRGSHFESIIKETEAALRRVM